MSNALRTSSGAVEIAQLANIGMVTVRADLADKDAVAAIEATTGQKLPETRKISGDVNNGIAWMSPDELMVFCADAAAMVTNLHKALTGHALVVDVSHARAVFSLKGKGAREVLAKGAPIDLSVDGFNTADFRRTRMGQVAVALWMENDAPEHFGLVCFASVQDFMFEWLEVAAAKGSLPEFLV